MTGKRLGMKIGTDPSRRIRASAAAIGMLPLLAALGACTTSAPAPQATARSAADTAPADLQLLCADAAAKATGAAANKVLPVTSRRVDARTYQVDLRVDGSMSSCIIDDAGNVVSVQASAT